MAVSPDGSKLYPLLEGALRDGEQFENVGRKRYLRLLEFDIKREAWTGRNWQYVLEDNQNAIGDFNMIDGTYGLVIERYNGEGTADKTCVIGAPTNNCFSQVTKFKRVYKIAFPDTNVEKPVGNDNHFLFPPSRQSNVADDSEFILLEVKDFLKQGRRPSHR